MSGLIAGVRVGVTFGIAALCIASAAESAPPPALSTADIERLHSILIQKSALGVAQGKVAPTLLFAMRALEQGIALASRPPAIPEFVQSFIDVNIASDMTTFVVIEGDTSSDLLAALAAMGARDVSAFAPYKTITAIVPVAGLLALAQRGDVRHIGPREKSIVKRRVPSGMAPNVLPKAGAVNWAGVAGHQADKAHFSGITGAGVKICVISNGVDSLAAKIASGELPAATTVLAGQAGSGDEGTAMLEIIHDMAPGATLGFATGYPSQALFATNIQGLRTTMGCDIIVDDVGYLTESAFQDNAIAQAVNSVSALGALYFSAAGNSGNLTHGTSATFEGDFVPHPAVPHPALVAFEGAPVVMHAFGAFPYTTLTRATNNVILQWSDPLLGSANDYDVFVMDATGTTILGSPGNGSQTGTQNPIESSECESCTFPVGSRIYVVKYSGQRRALRLDTIDGVIVGGTAGSTYGHSATAGAFAVGEVDVRLAVGGTLRGGPFDPVTAGSSDGPRRLFYTPAGTAITPGNILFVTDGGTTLAKVDFVAASCGTASAPGFGLFCGTSAAAATAAAMAALVKSANPAASNAQIGSALRASALDTEAFGIDRDSGSGIVMAPASVRAVLVPLTVSKSFVPPVIPPGGSSVLTIQVTNPNAIALQGIAFTDAYPSPIVNTAVAPSVEGMGCTASVVAANGSNNFLVSTAAVPAATTCTLRATVTSGASGAYVDASGTITTPIAMNTAAASATLNVGAPPGAPTLVVAVAGTAGVTLTFSPPLSNGGLAITGYVASCTPVSGGASVAASGSGSPIVVGGLVSSASYACTVAAVNAAGSGPPSAASSSVTPVLTSFALTVAKAGAGAGGVTSAPAGINCGTICAANFVSGTSVTLTANAAIGSTFGGWSGGGCSGTGTCMATVNAAVNVSATFTAAVTTRVFGISTRMQVLTGDNVLIGGFIISGGLAKTVVVRARGPSLGVAGALADPTLTLVPVSGPPQTNDDWGTAGNAAALSASGFAPSNAKESALMATLDPGAYTAIVSGVGNTTGIAIVEVYEIDQPASPMTAISTRGRVQTGDNVMIGGFIIQGDSPQTVVVRARGPSLGVAGALADPTLTLVPASGPALTNDDWGTAANAATLSAIGYAPSDPRESAILITLNPGAYTAIVSGVGGTIGVAIVEVYAP